MKKQLYVVLERVTVKLLLHLLKVSGGFPTFLITTLIEVGFDKIIIPILNHAIIQGHLYYDTDKGEIQIKNLHEARKGGSNAEYDAAVDDIIT